MMFRFNVIFAVLLLAAPLLIGPALADGQLRVVVPSHDIMRGQTMGDSDLAYQMVASAQPGVVTSMNDLSGMEARRYLRAGETVRADDVRHPVVVAKGSLVTMTFEAPGIMLTATGKAMSEGGVGETVTVVNPVSYRQIICTVTGPGMVRANNMGISLPGGMLAQNNTASINPITR
ncbi:MAG TPA: flagellar basal body P-ring formation chaperone FlgA [Rhizomicrobium sp.]|jgi:flagella basal body P-ring formation protein FlgA|nr:flagellar basal body P-ring formation chaperone FlgA [Rhizomicrobium sp.]